MQGKSTYNTYIFEFYLIFFTYKDTPELDMTADEMGQLWTATKFGNPIRSLTSIVFWIFTIVSYCRLIYCQSRARKNCQSSK